MGLYEWAVGWASGLGSGPIYGLCGGPSMSVRNEPSLPQGSIKISEWGQSNVQCRHGPGKILPDNSHLVQAQKPSARVFGILAAISKWSRRPGKGGGGHMYECDI